MAGKACLITEPDFPYCFWYILPEYYDIQYSVHSNVNRTVKLTLHCSVDCTIYCTGHFTLQGHQRGWPILECVFTLPLLHCTLLYSLFYMLNCTLSFIQFCALSFSLFLNCKFHEVEVKILVLSHLLSARNTTFPCQVFLKFTGITCLAN